MSVGTDFVIQNCMGNTGFRTSLKRLWNSFIVYSLIIGLPIVAVVYSGLSYAEKDGCDQALARDFRPSDFKALKRERKATSQKNTVIIAGRREGRFGGKLLELKRIGTTWNSYYTPNPENMQGDPRYFVMAVGPKIAAYFGFQFIDDRTMLVPDVTEFNGALKQLNEQLIKMGQEPIAVNFYSSSESGPEQQSKYLNAVAINFALPLADEGHYAIHDIAYHYGAILLPIDILKVLSAHIRLSEELKEYFVKNIKADKSAFREIVNNFCKSVGQKLEKYVDFGAGNIGFLFAAANYGQRHETYEVKDHVIRYLTLENMSPKEAIEKHWKEDVFLRETHSLLHSYAYEGVTEKEVKAFEKQGLAIFKDFLNMHKDDKDLKIKYKGTTEEFVNFVRARIVTMDRAIDLLQ